MPRSSSVVRRLPIEVEVVLGSWKAPIAELMRLRVGDRIVLPDGEDAWLAGARCVRIRRIAGPCQIAISEEARAIDILSHIAPL